MKRFRNILFVSQGAPGEAEAFQRALTLARRNDASLHAVRCLEGGGSDELLQVHQRELDQLVATAGSSPVRGGAMVLFGEPSAEIIGRVLSERHDLVIKTAENGYGAAGALFGNTDMELIRRCPCPVWVLKAGAEATSPCILAAVDPDHPDESGRQVNELILELASGLAETEGGKLHVAHCWTMQGESWLRGPFTPESRAHMDEMLAEEEKRRQKLLGDLLQALGDACNPHRAHLIHGEAREMLPALARDLGADLIVMGTLCRTGVSGLFIGNTAEELLRQVDCSVLTVKPGFDESAERPA